MHRNPPKIILASSSPYRRALLQQLGLSFDWVAPEIDESRLKNEPPEQLVTRLARQKAEALQGQFSNHLLIASDQVAVLNGQVLGKPGSSAHAEVQLKNCSGQKVTFLTSLSVLNTKTNKRHLELDRYVVEFRHLSDAQIKQYIKRDNPIDCAGSFKVEGLGAALFKRHHGNDPSSLIGLPIILLCSALLEEGVDVLA